MKLTIEHDDENSDEFFNFQINLSTDFKKCCDSFYKTFYSWHDKNKINCYGTKHSKNECNYNCIDSSGLPENIYSLNYIDVSNINKSGFDILNITNSKDLIDVAKTTKDWFEISTSIKPKDFIDVSQKRIYKNLEALNTVVQVDVYRKKKDLKALLQTFEFTNGLESSKKVKNHFAWDNKNSKDYVSSFYESLDLHSSLSMEEFLNELGTVNQMFLVSEEIDEGQNILEQIKALYKLLCSTFTRFQINRRENFRRINSFLFKNLDDYHSLALTSAGY